MKKQFTYKQIKKFDAVSAKFLANNGYFIDKVGFTEKPPTKFVENMKNVLKQWEIYFEEYLEEQQIIKRNNALVDEKTKAILREEVVNIGKDGAIQKSNVGNYKMTIEGENKAAKEIKELDNKLVEIKCRITEAKDCPPLSETETEAFEGLIIPASAKEADD